jgi:hypothetical protein
LALTAAGLLVGLGLLEVAVRVLYAPELDPGRIRQRQADGHFGALIRYVDDARLYYELTPHLDIDFHGNRFVTDADGVRVRVVPRPMRAPEPSTPAARPLRIAVVGASSTLGFKLPMEHTWPERVLPALEDAWRRPMELRNFSVPAYNSIQQCRQFVTRIVPWSPDVVLWHYDHRDAFPTVLPGRPAELPPEYGDNPLGSAFWRLIARRLHAHQLLLDDGGDDADTCEHYPTSGAAFDRHLHALRRAGALASSRDIPILLVMFDAFARRLPAGAEHHARLHVPLIPRLEQAGFTVLDLYPHYQQVMRDRDWTDLRAWWTSIEPLDGHPNDACHEWMGERVIEFVLDHPRFVTFRRG